MLNGNNEPTWRSSRKWPTVYDKLEPSIKALRYTVDNNISFKTPLIIIMRNARYHDMIDFRRSASASHHGFSAEISTFLKKLKDE